MVLDLFGSDLRLLSELPEIRRAREYRLYDAAGRRYLDLYQDCGRAVLGHRPDGLSKAVRNTFSRGIAADFPSANERTLVKALSRLLPRTGSFRIYRSTLRAATVLLELGVSLFTDPLTDLTVRLPAPASVPLRTEPPSGGTGVDPASVASPGGAGDPVEAAAVWRPFSELPYDRYAALVPVLPFPGSWGPVVVAFGRGLDAPPSDPVSPVYLSGLARAAWDLVNADAEDQIPEPVSRHSVSSEYPGTDRKPGLSDTDRRRTPRPESVPSDLWRRNGRYLVPRYREADHERIFRIFLSRGILLPPSAALPAVLPAAWSRSEERAFAEACAESRVRGTGDGA